MLVSIMQPTWLSWIGYFDLIDQSDIFVILVSANYRIPLTKFFMKRELWWIPFIFLANNIEKVARFYIQSANIPDNILKEIM